MQHSVADSAGCSTGLHPVGKMFNLMASLRAPCKGESPTQEAGAQHSAQALMGGAGEGGGTEEVVKEGAHS